MSKTIKIIVIIASLNITSFGACFYLFEKIKKIDEVVSSRLIEIDLEVKKDQALKSTKSLMDDTKKERDQIAGFFIKSNGAVDFIENVESLGKIANVKLTIESVGVEVLKSKQASSSVETFRLAVKTEGSWVNTIHLLSLLENSPFKISFGNVGIEKTLNESSDGKEGNSSPHWTGNLSFSVLKIRNSSENSAKVN